MEGRTMEGGETPTGGSENPLPERPKGLGNQKAKTEFGEKRLLGGKDKKSWNSGDIHEAMPIKFWETSEVKSAGPYI
jgi:hypothetical protein